MVETWDYCKATAEPYACLILPGDGEDAAAQVVLDQTHASALAVAIGGWADSLRHHRRALARQGLTAEIETLQVRLSGPSPENPEPWAEFTFRGADSLQRTATLTYLEAWLLAEALGSIVPGEPQEAEV